jgi:hypothetical protein
LHALPTGTLSTPLRCFAALRDQDRPESVLAASALLMQSDDDVAHSLRVPSDRRWTTQEREQVTALRQLMDTLRVTPQTTLRDMDAAVERVHDGLGASATAQARARSAQARLHAVEDEVFAQSVKLLHQQSQRKHRHGERENNLPTDLLDIDTNLLADLSDPTAATAAAAAASATVSSSAGSPAAPAPAVAPMLPCAPSKAEMGEVNRVLEEYCRDLFKIFSYYCATSAAAQAQATSSGAGGVVSGGASSLLVSATEPRMDSSTWWRFVRDCKLKLPQTALIDSVFALMLEQAARAMAEPLKTNPSQTAGSDGSSDVVVPPSSTGLLPEDAPTDIGFKQLGSALLRLSLIKFPSEKNLARKLRNLLLGHVLPNAAAKALQFHKAQANASAAAANAVANAAANQSGGAGAGGAGQSNAGGANSSSGAGTGLLSLSLGSNPEVDAVFRKHGPLLKAVFQIYARLGGAGGVATSGSTGSSSSSSASTSAWLMTFNDFLGFAREFELLHKYVTQHDLKQLFSHAVREGGAAEAAAAALAAGNAVVAAAVAAAAAASVPGAQGAAVGPSDGGTANKRAEEDDDTSSSNAPASVPKELTYRSFLELLAAVSHYVIRNPYFSTHDRVDKFILSVLASRKKLPQKVYRSAV